MRTSQETCPYSDWLVLILNFKEHLKRFQFYQAFKSLHVNFLNLKIVILRHDQDWYCKDGGDISMQIRIKLTFIGLPLTNKHCNKHCLALTKMTKWQRIKEFSLFVFQRFLLNGIYNFFRCEINDKATTILPIVTACSSYKNFCVVKLYI